VGLALLVTQDAEDRTAAVLLLETSRLVVGLERAQAAITTTPETERWQRVNIRDHLGLPSNAPHADVIAAIKHAREEADALRAECVDLKRRYDERTARLKSCMDLVTHA